MNLLKRLWLSLRGGTAYKQLEQQGRWATWQLPNESERRETQPDDEVSRPDKHRDWRQRNRLDGFVSDFSAAIRRRGG